VRVRIGGSGFGVRGSVFSDGQLVSVQELALAVGRISRQG
jgi:hypothetical protein